MVVTGVIWFLDVFYLAKQRRAAADRALAEYDERSSVSAGTSLRRVEALPTSTWARAGAATALPAASKKARRADQGDDGATGLEAKGVGHKKHMQE
eukprot:gene35288-43506_t